MIAGADRRARRAIAAGATLVALAAAFWRIGRPAVWTDEAATADAVRRSWGGLAHLLLGRDAPLVPYYVVAKIWYSAVGLVHTGDPWTVCRWLSALLASGCVGLLAWWLAGQSRTVAVVAAGTLVALPGFERYAQEARPYSAMMLVATWSWLEWHRLITGAGRGGHRYSATIVALSLVNPFALVQVVAQCVATTLSRRRVGAAHRAAAWRAMALGVLTGAPWTVWAAAHGRGPGAAHRQLSWHQVQRSATQLVSGPLPSTTMPIMLVVLVCAAIAAGRLVAGPGRRDLTIAALPWALAAPVLLPLAGAAVQVALVPRYWLSSLPGIAVLVGLAADRICASVAGSVRRRAAAGRAARGGVAALVVVGVALLGAGAQRSMRRGDGHGEASRGAIEAASTQRLHDLPILFATGGDALVIGEARPQLQKRIVGWNQSRHGRNVSETAWHVDRSRTALATHTRALLLVRYGGVFRRERSRASLLRLIGSTFPGLRGRGIDPTATDIVFEGGSWIVAECTLQHQDARTEAEQVHGSARTDGIDEIDGVPGR